MATTYTKGSSGDTLTWQGNMTVSGTQTVTGAQTFSGAIALGAIADASGFELSDSTTRGAGLFTELPSTGTAISAGKVVHGVESRFVINKDQTTTNDTSLYALTGHLRVKQDLPQSSCFGTWAYFEQSGTVAGTFGGALRAKVEAEAGLTQAKVYGILVDGAVASGATISTDFAAIRIATDIEGAGGKKAWIQGVLIDGATTTGINVAPSAATTGVSIGLTGKTYTTGVALGVTGATLTTGMATAGTVTTGISFAATTANHIVFAAVGTGTDGNLIKGGTVGAGALSCGTTADTSFVKLYTRSAATSGDARGIYNRLYIGGAGGSGESLRSFTTVDAGKAAATVHGAHLSLSFEDATASVTGLGVAMRATLHVPNGAVTAGTRAAVQAEIYTDGSSADIAGQLVSAFRVVVDGSEGTGKTNADTNAYFLDLSGVTAGATGFVDTDITTGTHHSGLRVRMPDGSTKWIAIISA